MKLVIFIASLECGGAERTAANLANYWNEKGWSISLVTIGPICSDFYKLDARINRISLRIRPGKSSKLAELWLNIKIVIALRRVLKKILPDIALSMMISSNVHLAIATIGTKILSVGSEHFHPPNCPSGPIWEVLRRYSYFILGAVTTLTHDTAKWLEANTYVRHVSVICNPNIWPLPLQSPILPISSICSLERKVLLAVGRLSSEKGFDLLISAFDVICHDYPDWDLVILGEGSLRSVLNHQIQDSCLDGRVFLPGNAGNIGEWYERADLYVMSSRFEGFGNVLVEALSYGLPVVSFDCDTGPRNIIRHGIDGLLVEHNDFNALALAIARLMGNATLRQQFSINAVEARDRFSIEKIARLWDTLFKGLG